MFQQYPNLKKTLDKRNKKNLSEEEIIQKMVDIDKKLMLTKIEFSDKHGFAYKRPQNFKNCIVIRWKTSNHSKIEEYTELSNNLSEKYNLWETDSPFLEIQLRLIKIGIYVLYESYFIWAIPNEFKDIQEEVLNKLPKWAKVTIK
jgi:hypothetical protein